MPLMPRLAGLSRPGGTTENTEDTENGEMAIGEGLAPCRVVAPGKNHGEHGGHRDGAREPRLAGLSRPGENHGEHGGHGDGARDPRLAGSSRPGENHGEHGGHGDSEGPAPCRVVAPRRKPRRTRRTRRLLEITLWLKLVRCYQLLISKFLGGYRIDPRLAGLSRPGEETTGIGQKGGLLPGTCTRA